MHICEDISTIQGIIFGNFTVFQYRSDLPQVKLNLIFSITSLVYELPHELLNDLRLQTKDLRKLGNIRKISNQGGDIAWCPVSLPETKLSQQQLKNMQNVDIKLFLSCHWISLFYSKYFVRDGSKPLKINFMPSNIENIS